MTVSRRGLLKMAAGGALMPWAPGVNVALGAENAPGNILVYVFLRFGMDGLQLLAPADDGNYRDKRRMIGLPISGPGRALPVGSLDGVPFFLHPQAEPLARLYYDGSLAFVHAAGLPTNLRSHFEVQEQVDMGVTETESAVTGGWLARHLIARGAGDLAATADAQVGSSSLRGAPGVVPTSDLEALPYYMTSERAELMSALNAGNSASAKSVRQTLNTIEVVRQRAASLPRTDGPAYTWGALSQKLEPLARAIKLNVGVEVATVDFGGWDHHDNIITNFNTQARELARALFIFAQDLGPLMNRVTIVAMTEFGRRVEENANVGTDHGAASAMILMGAGVNGGKIYGAWPGLGNKDLDGGDLRVTTDYRQVLGEVLVKRLGQTRLENVFPTLGYKPLDIVRAL